MIAQLALLDKNLDPSMAGTLAGLALAAAVFSYQQSSFAGLDKIGDGFLHAFFLLLLSVVVDALGFPLAEGLFKGFTGDSLAKNLPVQGANVSSEYFLFVSGVGILMATGFKLAGRRGMSLPGLLNPLPILESGSSSSDPLQILRDVESVLGTSESEAISDDLTRNMLPDYPKNQIKAALKLLQSRDRISCLSKKNRLSRDKRVYWKREGLGPLV